MTWVFGDSERVEVPRTSASSLAPLETSPRSARDRTIKKVKRIGRRQWKKAAGYHQQARVENAFFRYKSVIGHRLRARNPGGQEAEALLACNVLNAMTDMGRPASYAIGR
jgi:hypothetical protein